jgi:transcriptional regulator with XRE-family HTH domain
MSTEVVFHSLQPDSAPELTALGKRLEILRIERGVSKQHLARHAGTSRQQLWRVMTGKSDLTSSLCERLATALAVQPSDLSSSGSSSGFTQLPSSLVPSGVHVPSSPTVADYLADATFLAASLRTLPSGDSGRRLKRALLNAVEDLAVEAGFALPLDYSEIRRRVLSGEL